MKLIGMLDSPFVRRAAITLHLKGLPFEHQSLSVFRNFDEFQAINPLVKAPTLVGDEGWQLVDSSLIIDWAESTGSGGCTGKACTRAAGRTRARGGGDCHERPCRQRRGACLCRACF